MIMFTIILNDQSFLCPSEKTLGDAARAKNDKGTNCM